MIVAKDIVKEIKGKKILDNISFHIAPGEIVGVVGKNGAGKTTLLKVLSGVMSADQGFVRVKRTEKLFQNKEILRELSYIAGDSSGLWQDMRLIDSLDHCCNMYHLDRMTYKKKLGELTELLQIEDCMQKQISSLSQGQKMRGKLAYGLLMEPKLLFLDEAMIGLDVAIKENVICYLEKLREQKNMTIIYTSHNLREVERICERVIILDKGKVLLDEEISELKKQYGNMCRVKITCMGNIPDIEDLPVETYLLTGDNITITYDKSKLTTALLIKHFVDRGTVKDVDVMEPELDDTMRALYERKEYE